MYFLNERAEHLRVLPQVSKVSLIKPPNLANNLPKIQTEKCIPKVHKIKKNQIEDNYKVKKAEFFNRKIIRKRKRQRGNL